MGNFIGTNATYPAGTYTGPLKRDLLGNVVPMYGQFEAGGGAASPFRGNLIGDAAIPDGNYTGPTGAAGRKKKSKFGSALEGRV